MCSEEMTVCRDMGTVGRALTDERCKTDSQWALALVKHHGKRWHEQQKWTSIRSYRITGLTPPPPLPASDQCHSSRGTRAGVITLILIPSKEASAYHCRPCWYRLSSAFSAFPRLPARPAVPSPPPPRVSLFWLTFTWSCRTRKKLLVHRQILSV